MYITGKIFVQLYRKAMVLKSMNTTYETLEYNTILQLLSDKAVSPQAKAMCLKLTPICQELKLRKEMRDTTQARLLLQTFGNPPLPLMEQLEEKIQAASKGELLPAEDMEAIGSFLIAVERMLLYLKKGCEQEVSLAFYCENLNSLPHLQEEIKRSIRNGEVDDYASTTLRDIRRSILTLEDKMKAKADQIMKSQKSAMAESFVVSRNGHICVPVKKDCKSKIPGSVIDTSKSASTLFIEPAAIGKLQEEVDVLRIEEDNEVRRILYTLLASICEHEAEISEDIRTLTYLDFVFAKGKLSLEMEGIQPVLNTDRHIKIVQGRHPFLSKEACVPLDFELGYHNYRGMIITGPNTGGKTVTIKTVGLFCLMACSGLHIPCREADICMNNQVLCDIGDGQNIADNLSTFSSHITNVISILRQVTGETLVILDEVGSGTDPQEGMGIAVSIIEQLRKSSCLFLITTHYPEVKTYAEECQDIINARMGFDRDTLTPLYRLEAGKSGESCALYIAMRLGMPKDMIDFAGKKAYGEVGTTLSEADNQPKTLTRLPAPRIEKIPADSPLQKNISSFSRGDCVTVYPEGQLGIVVKPADDAGNVLVQIKKEKKLYNHTRLKLKIAADALYPEDYDFSVIFDTVSNRKARHQMEKGHFEGYEVQIGNY